MSDVVSIKRSIFEEFNFKDKIVRSVYVQGDGECIFASDVYRGVGYERKAGIKAINRLVPEKYRMRYGDVMSRCRVVPKSGDPPPDSVLLKEPGLYCFLLRCDKEDAEPFMEWAVETVLPREVRKLAEENEKKDSAIALLNDDLGDRNTRIQALEFDNVALQAQRDVYETQLQRCQNQIAELRDRSVPHAQRPELDNIVKIIRKNSKPEDDEFYELPLYIARMQKRHEATKDRWFRTNYPNHEVVVTLENANAIHAFNRFEEQGYVDRYQCHFRLVNATGADLDALAY